MSNDLILKQKRTQALAGKIAAANTGTLMMHGVDPEKYKTVLVEALVNVKDILKANEASLAAALRGACQFGVLPNGRESFMYVSKRDGSVRFMLMRDGLCKIAHRTIGAEIRSGFIREGQEDDIEIIKDTKKGDRVIVRESFKSVKPNAKIVGAWCHISVPGGKPYAHPFYRDDIDKAKAASQVKGKGGPWDTWEGRMAEKSCVKSCIAKALYMYQHLDQRGAHALAGAVKEDDRNDLEGTLVIDAPEPQVVGVVSDEASSPDDNEAPPQQPPKKQARKKKPEPEVEDAPVADVPTVEVSEEPPVEDEEIPLPDDSDNPWTFDLDDGDFE